MLRCFNVKSSTYFLMKTKILADFQICISVPLSKVTSWIFPLKFLFSLLSIFLSYLSLLLNSNKAYKIIFKTMFDVRKEHIALHITIFVQQYLHDNNCTHNTSYSWWNMEKKEQPYKFTSRRCFCRGWQGKYRSS